MNDQSRRDDDIMLFSALNRNTEAGRLQGVVVPNLASQADREQQFEPGADIDSAAELCCCHVPMYLLVSNSVLQDATSFVKSVIQSRRIAMAMQARDSQTGLQ